MPDYSSLILKPCLPGTLLDTSINQIDGSCITGENTIEGGVLVGKVVNVESVEDGYKIVSDVFDAQQKPFGIAMRSHMNTSHDESGFMQYNHFDPMSVITRGRVWALTQNIEEPPEPFSQAYVSVAGTIEDEATGEQPIDGWAFTGEFMKWTSEFNMVGVQLSHHRIHIERKKLVAAAAIETQSDEYYIEGNKSQSDLIRLKVSVAPDDAHDKSGTWSLISIGDVNADDIVKLNPDQGGDPYKINVRRKRADAFGQFYVHWKANDASGAQDMFKVWFVSQSAT